MMKRTMILTAVAAFALVFSGCNADSVQAQQDKMKHDLTLFVTVIMQDPENYNEEYNPDPTNSYSSRYMRILHWMTENNFQPWVDVSLFYPTEAGWRVIIEPPIGLKFRDPELTSRGVLAWLHNALPELKCCEIVTSLGIGANLCVRYAVKEGFSVREERW